MPCHRLRHTYETPTRDLSNDFRNDRSFKCSNCEFVTGRTDILKRHIDSQHPARISRLAQTKTMLQRSKNGSASTSSVSEVWRYFSRVDPKTAKCTLCEFVDVRPDSEGRRPTSHLWRHLKSAHREVFTKTKFFQARKSRLFTKLEFCQAGALKRVSVVIQAALTVYSGRPIPPPPRPTRRLGRFSDMNKKTRLKAGIDTLKASKSITQKQLGGLRACIEGLSIVTAKASKSESPNFTSTLYSKSFHFIQ